MNILLADKTTLQERFAEIDIHTIRRELNNSQDTADKIPAKIRTHITLPQFPETRARILLPFAQAA